MRKFVVRGLGVSLIAMFIAACGNSSVPIPKPPTYLRIDAPDHVYTSYNENCPYTFEINEAYTVKNVSDSLGPTCHKDIDFGPLNGMLHFSYIDMKEPVATYINYSNDKVDDHKVKATGIEDFQIIRPEDRVFGTFFSLQGDVAAPFHFYLTDSTDRFVSGIVYFNSVPNYDSLKPSMDYVELDLKHLVETFKWK